MEIHHGIVGKQVARVSQESEIKTFDMDTPKTFETFNFHVFGVAANGTIKLDRARVYAYSSSHPYQISTQNPEPNIFILLNMHTHIYKSKKAYLEI